MSLLTTLVSSKIAAGAIAVSTLAVGGTAAAAATGTLPDAAQEAAHQFVGAPSPAAQPAVAADDDAQGDDTTEANSGDESTDTKTEESSTGTPSSAAPSPSTDTTTTTAVKGPDASMTSSATKGLCTAYTHGGLHNPKSTAYKALVTAAGSASVQDYCTIVLAAASQSTSATDIPSIAPSTPAKHHHVRHHHKTEVKAVHSESDDQGGDDQGEDQGDEHESESRTTVSTRSDDEHESESRDGEDSSEHRTTQHSDSNDDQGGDDQGEHEGSDD
jgi:hypothetical protein